MLGVRQPIADATKLISKEFFKLNRWKISLFISGPLIAILVILVCWILFNYKFSIVTSNIEIIIILRMMGLSTYRFTTIRWGSNSKYSILGGYRSIAQIISYEVCLVIFIIAIIYTSYRINLEKFKFIQNHIWVAIFSIPFFLCWVIICIAEANRTPFDLSEGESEIVSGFNVEYGGGIFAIIFIAEYGIIIFLNFLTVLVFLGSKRILVIMFILNFIFIWVRCSFPRVRYDILIISSWKILLPLRLCILIILDIFFSLKDCKSL